jgi:sulfur-oxidizing protein SoxY
MNQHSIDPLQRRNFLYTCAKTAVLLLTYPYRTLLAGGSPNDARKWLNQQINGAVSQEGKISIDIPSVTKRGDFIPITVRVDSPMTEQNYVKAIHIAAQRNPTPAIGSFFFSPANPEAVVTTRIRLVKTQVIEVVAVMSNGSVWTSKARTKIFTGAKGCS